VENLVEHLLDGPQADGLVSTDAGFATEEYERYCVPPELPYGSGVSTALNSPADAYFAWVESQSLR